VGRVVAASFPEDGRDAAKRRGEMLHLNNSKSFKKNTHIFQSTKNYFYIAMSSN